MSPAEIALALEMLEAAIQAEPALQSAIVAVFSKPNPTPADWDALRVKVISKNYRDYVPDTQLPLSLTPPAPVVTAPPAVVAADTSAAAVTADTSAVIEAAPVVSANALGHVSPMA